MIRLQAEITAAKIQTEQKRDQLPITRRVTVLNMWSVLPKSFAFWVKPAEKSAKYGCPCISPLTFRGVSFCAPAAQLATPFKVSLRQSRVKPACLMCDCAHVCSSVTVAPSPFSPPRGGFSSRHGWFLTSDTRHSRKRWRGD